MPKTKPEFSVYKESMNPKSHGKLIIKWQSHDDINVGHT